MAAEFASRALAVTVKSYHHRPALWRDKGSRMQHMVIYCEHAGGLWTEPLNTLSALAYLASAYMGARLLRAAQSPQAPAARSWDLWLLILSLALVGLSGLLWHQHVASWAGRLDLIAMLAFINLYLVVFLSRAAGFSTCELLLVVALFQGLSVMLSGRFAPHYLNGGWYYLPALLAFWLLALWSLQSRRVAAWPMLAGASLFSLSLGLRTVDMAWCLSWPHGTHFLWHLANAAAFYLLLRGLLTQPRHAQAVQAS